MKTLHTPGPWHIGGKDRHDAPVNQHLPRVWGPDHAGIADICTRRPLGNGVSKTELANAYLIALAPDLLAALELALTVTEWSKLESGEREYIRIILSRAKHENAP